MSCFFLYLELWHPWRLKKTAADQLTPNLPYLTQGTGLPVRLTAAIVTVCAQDTDYGRWLTGSSNWIWLLSVPWGKSSFTLFLKCNSALNWVRAACTPQPGTHTGLIQFLTTQTPPTKLATIQLISSWQEGGCNSFQPGHAIRLTSKVFPKDTAVADFCQNTQHRDHGSVPGAQVPCWCISI